MSRQELSWRDVNANADAGTSAFTSGSKMLAGALENLRAPLDRANDITQQNAKSESEANTGVLMDAIRRGENPEMTGAYDSQKVGDARYDYKKDDRDYGLKRDRLNNAINRVNGRNSRGGSNTGRDFVELIQGFNADGEISNDITNELMLNQRTVDTGDSPALVLNEQIAKIESDRDVDASGDGDDVVKRNYDSMIAYGLSNPKKFKEAQSQFNKWKKGYLKSNGNMTDTDKFLRQKEEAEYWRSVGYNKNGTSIKPASKKSKKKSDADYEVPVLNMTPAPTSKPVAPVEKNVAPVIGSGNTSAPAPANIPEEKGFFESAYDSVADIFSSDDRTHDEKIDALAEATGADKKTVKKEYWKEKRKAEKDQKSGKNLKTVTMEDLYAEGMKPTEEELRDMPKDLLKKLRGGYKHEQGTFSTNATPLNNPVFRDRRGNPVIRNGQYMFSDGNGGVASTKDGYRYSPPLDTTGELTVEELEYDNRQYLKRMPKGTRILKDGRFVLPNGDIAVPKSKKDK